MLSLLKINAVDSDVSFFHYGSKVWGHLEIIIFERKAHFCPLKLHQIDQKYSVDIVNVVNDCCSWKWLIFYGTST